MLNTTHEGFDPLDRNITKLGFNLTLSLNQNIDEKVIFTLLKQQSQNGKNDLVNRFITFFEHIEHFGLGIVILPSIIMNLAGKLFVRYEKLKIETNANLGGNGFEHINFDDENKLKITFIVPLVQLMADNIKSPYRPLNKTKET